MTTPRTKSIKNKIKRKLNFTYESQSHFLCFSISKLSQTLIWNTAIGLEWVAVVVHVFQTTQNLVISRCCFLQRTANKSTKNSNAHVQLLLCSLNLLVSDDVIAVVVFLNSIMVLMLENTTDSFGDQKLLRAQASFRQLFRVLPNFRLL